MHSMGMVKISKPAPLGPFRDTNYNELFLQLLSSNTLFKSDTINQQTIPLSADVKRRVVSLDADHVLQPQSKLFLIQEVKVLPRFFGKRSRLVMIGNSCLKPFRAAVMRVLFPSTQPPNFSVMSRKYWKVGTHRKLVLTFVAGF